MDDLVIVDCQYDFIDGTLACGHSHEAVKELVDFMNSHEVRALYTSDWHSETNGSFKVNGGIWPVHCVAGTKGAELDPAFTKDVKNPANRPSPKNRFLKGRDDKVEEYSAFHGRNEEGKALGDVASSHVYVGGIASEYCVKETVLSLLASGRTVTVLVKGLGYVSEEDHRKALNELEKMGVVLEGQGQV
ncbi:isochorismatase family protein [uncultured Dialister sp.]|uniref:isochorismatase family protein n=1 Tax=uncultured Dialister sp. TaxID=278064 RepID=UPI0025F532C3|nr:isochorismatase family protein [uncultured Dialister sp.]